MLRTREGIQMGSDSGLASLTQGRMILRLRFLTDGPGDRVKKEFFDDHTNAAAMSNPDIAGLKPSTLLVTGGAGFIGSNFIRDVLRRDHKLRVVNLDLLTYAGNLESLNDVTREFGGGGEPRYRFAHGDIKDADLVAGLLAGGNFSGSGVGRSGSEPDWVPDAIVHFAAESHVDRSIVGSGAFVETNVNGTLALLEASRRELSREPRSFAFVHVSTDEVYGSLGPTDPAFTELSPVSPNSPYSASKAGSDHLVRAYVETHGLPAMITRCSNNYGPYQFPEKLIPLMITRALHDEPLPVYGDGLNVRDWVHVQDHTDAVWTVLTKGRVGEVYNIGGRAERTNIAIVQELLRLLEKPESLVEFVPDRPGHDGRYAMDITKLEEEMGWSPQREFETGLKATVDWYLNNRTWWERILSEEYAKQRR